MNKNLRDTLKERDSPYYHNLHLMWENSKELQERQTINDPQRSGKEHCEKVEHYLYQLVSFTEENISLRDKELFILSAAACLHDIGKPQENFGEFISFLKEELNFTNKELSLLFQAKFLRNVNKTQASEHLDDEHGLISATILKKNFEKFYIDDEKEGLAICKIIRAHNNPTFFRRLSKEDFIRDEKINIKYLAAIFILADVLDCDYSRTPKNSLIISKAYLKHGKIKFRKAVQGWYRDKMNPSKIILIVNIEKEKDKSFIFTGIKGMNKDLEPVARFLKKINLPYKISYKLDYNIKFKEEMEISKEKRGFVGLASLTEDDLFKGREEEIGKLIGAVLINKITLLLGKSGIGKTSLIEAGIIPKLQINKNIQCLFLRLYEKLRLEDVNKKKFISKNWMMREI